MSFFCFCFFPVQREPSPAADQGNTRLPCRKPWWSVARTHCNYIWGEQPFHPQPLTIFPCCWWFIARYNARCFGGHTPVIFKTTVVIFDGKEGTFCSWHTEWENPAVQLWATSNKQTSANQSNIFNFIWCLQTEAIRYVICYECVAYCPFTSFFSSASQAWCLGRFFPLLVGDLVPEGDEKWENYL